MVFRGDYWFLSNMYPTELKDEDGRVYSCVEAMFQSRKCKNADDRERFVGINGFDAKRLGKRIALRDDWESIKVAEMEAILMQKFSKPELKSMLKAIDGEIAEENTWHDTYWGVCNGYGQNNLGKLLMKIRNLA